MPKRDDKPTKDGILKELSAGDPELLRWVQVWTGCSLGEASSLLTIIKRYLDGEVSKEEIDKIEQLQGVRND